MLTNHKKQQNIFLSHSLFNTILLFPFLCQQPSSQNPFIPILLLQQTKTFSSVKQPWYNPHSHSSVKQPSWYNPYCCSVTQPNDTTHISVLLSNNLLDTIPIAVLSNNLRDTIPIPVLLSNNLLDTIPIPVLLSNNLLHKIPQFLFFYYTTIFTQSLDFSSPTTQHY